MTGLHLRHSAVVFVLLGCGAGLVSPTALEAQVPPLYYDDPVWEWKDNRDPDSWRTSPNAVVGLQLGFGRVMISYGRPGVRGRRVFGGLVGWERLWRTGADEAPTITFTEPVEVEGHPLEAGTYALFTIPAEDDWTVIFSADANQMGAYSYDPAEEVLRFEVPTEAAPFLERLRFTFEELDPEAGEASVALHWEETKVRFRVREP